MKYKLFKTVFIILSIGVLFSNSYGKDVQSEKLNIGLPNDWKVAFSNLTNEYIVELTPKSESFDHWTKMITIQKFPNPESYTLESFMSTVKKGANQACSQLEVADVITSEQNGFKFMQKNFHCIKKEDNQKEIFNMKVIKGIDYLYVIQFAYRVKLSDEEYMKWAYYLKDAVVERIEK